MRRRLDGKRVLILPALLAVFGLFTFLSSPQAHASPGVYYHRGYSVQGTWLCYGWSNGSYYCTQHWRVSNGRYLSYNPRVPSQGVAVAYYHPVTASHPVAAPATPVSPNPVGISQWAYTGLGSFTQPGGVSNYPYGQCTYVAAWLGGAGKLSGLGNAESWAANARWRGLATGTSPSAGATVVFQSFVQGAGGLGHVAHVVRVYSNGWFLVEEGNFGWNGGGWGRVDFRYAHTGWGVSFIY